MNEQVRENAAAETRIMSMEEALQSALRDLYRQVQTKNAGPITELEIL